MRVRTSAIVLAVLAGVHVWATSASAVGPERSGFDLNPGERVIAVDGVPVGTATQADGGAYNSGRPVANSTRRFAGGARERVASGTRNVATGATNRFASGARNIVGRLTRTGQPFSHTPGSTALEKANYERRKNGMGPLTPDPALQRLALQKAKTAAARGQKNHVGGSLGGAKAEGVGHTNGRFLSCCLDMPATYGGAAMVQGSDGWYCCLLVR